jgi:SAGA-associated factor 73
MHGLSNWNPQPLVQPPVHVPIEKQYFRQRLYEQLHNATNGFTVNIFKVSGDGAKKRPNGDIVIDAEGDAEGELDPSALPAGMASVAARRATGLNMQMPPQRRASSASHSTGR